VYDLPAIFVIDNNLYGVSTHAQEATGLSDLAVRAAGYNIPGLIVDGMNPLAVKRAIAMAKAHAVDGRGPVLVEAKTYRYLHQSGDMAGSAFGYRTKEEEAEWAGRDPIKLASDGLMHSGILAADGVACVREVATALVADAVDFCTEVIDDQPRRIRPDLIPAGDDVIAHIRSDGHEFDGVAYPEIADYTETRDTKLVTAKSEVIARWLTVDPETFVVGEDVANLKGGPYGATREALKVAPERVHNAPIAEAGIVGMGHGAAVAGMRPIAELMFCDFALIGADALFNQIATCRYMYNGRVDVPLVVRSRCSAQRGFGAQHSGDTAGLFALYPGWRIIAPTNPFDYIGLFNSAMRSLDPVLFLEHHELDPISGAVPKDDLDYLIPLGKAAIPRAGDALTIVTYLSLVPRVLRIAEEIAGEKAIEIEVVDLRCLDHASIDFDLIYASAAKTGKVMIVEQAMETQSLGHHIAARIHENSFGELARPVMRVCSQSAPIPVSKTLEDTILIRDETIREKILELI
jgi:2-oxoisovalerate dehydrogenase E1 component